MRRIGLSALAVCASGIGVVAYLYFNGVAGSRSTAKVPAMAPPVVSVSAPLTREIVEWKEYTGQFEAIEDVEIRARVSGYLTEIHFVDGQSVNKGDLLFVIDPRPFEIVRDGARAQLDQAAARLELANRQLFRAAELRQKGFAAASTYDERLQEVRVATGQVSAAKAAIRAAELDLEFTRITAPISGRISRHEVSAGNLIFGGTSGATTLLTTIVSVDPVYCVFDVSEADVLTYRRAIADGALKVVPGEFPIEARLADEKEWTLKGQLNFVENRLDRGSGTLRVRASFSVPDRAISAGQFAKLRTPASAPHQAILIPDEAIVSDQSRKLVMLVGEDGTVIPRPVELGPLYEGLRIIREGLGPGDRLIISGLMRARPGGKVTAQPGEIALRQQG